LQRIVNSPKREPIVYLIRHAEKPPKNSKGEDPPGLSAEGLTRAEALVDTFSNASRYNIDFILAEHPKKSRIYKE
jgi:broad specificity phosphatase PhoE